MTLFAQEWKMKKQLNFENNITAYAKNNQNEIYLGFDNGALIILDEEGEELLYNAEINNAEVTSIDPSNRLRPLIFRREQQSINFIDRFNNSTTKIDLSEINTQFVWLCTQGAQNELWLFTSNFLEIVKHNIVTGLTTAIPLVTQTIKLEEPVQMTVFKNLLIILDKSLGVVLFDQFRNFLKTIPDSHSSRIDLHNQQVVILQKGAFVFISPFDLAPIKKIKAPVGAFKKFLWLDNKSIVAIWENELKIYSPR